MHKASKGVAHRQKNTVSSSPPLHRNAASFLRLHCSTPLLPFFFKLKTMYKHTFLLTLSALLLASSLGARTPEGPTTKPLPPDSLAAVYDLNQVVVTGARHPRPLRTSPV